MYKYDCTSTSPGSWVGSWSSPDFWVLNRNSVGYTQDPDHLQFYCITFSCATEPGKASAALLSCLNQSVLWSLWTPEIRNGLAIRQEENLVYLITLALQLFITAINLAYPEWHLDTNIDSHGQSIVSRIRSGELGISVIILQTLWPRKYTHFWNWNEEKSTEI